jgi:hypothetical protein
MKVQKRSVKKSKSEKKTVLLKAEILFKTRDVVFPREHNIIIDATSIL